MNRGEGQGVFETPRRPVELPSEGAARSVRRALLAVALAVLLGGVASGLLYHRFWKTVSHEVSWLLPASTQLYARIPRPWEALLRTTELPQWTDPPGLRRRLLRDGLLGDLAPLEIAGIPTQALVGLARQARELQVALVPSPEGYGLLLFVRLSGADAVRGASRALQVGMPVVDRHLGYAIHAARQPALRAPWGEPVLRLRYVEMPPFILLSLGPEAPLLDVLQAKVSGTSQPIRTREGFEPLPKLAAGAGASAFVDPGPVFEALQTLLGMERDPRAGEDLRVAVARQVLGLTLKSELRRAGEALRVVARLRDPAALRALEPALGRAPRRLLGRAPADADLAAAVGVTSLAAIPKALSKLLGGEHPVTRAARRALTPDIEGGSLTFGRLGLWTDAAAVGLVIPAGSTADRSRWVVELALPPGPGAADAVARAAQRALGEPTAHGVIYDATAATQAAPPSQPTAPAADGGPGGPHEAPLHVLADADRPARIRLAWRRDGDIVDAAPSPAALQSFYAARRRHGTAAARGLVERATETLPPSSAAVVMAHPRLLRGVWQGAGDALVSRLAGSTRLAAALTAEPASGTVAASLNLGPLSLALAGVIATRRELDRAALPQLPDACLDALETLCAADPTSVPCEPWQPRRKALVTNACRRALQAPPGGDEGRAGGARPGAVGAD